MANVATILTLGYEKRDLPEFIRLLRQTRVDVVLDVRETAWSHKPGFSKGRFSTALAEAGIEYVHARFAGNPKTLRQAAKSHADCLIAFNDYLDRDVSVELAFDRLIRDCLLKELRVCLVCFERHPGDCHRGVLAGRWAARHGGKVEHVAPDGCPRLAPSFGQA
jgi:uncharacterized protein (DUF488 family)